MVRWDCSGRQVREIAMATTDDLSPLSRVLKGMASTPTHTSNSDGHF